MPERLSLCCHADIYARLCHLRRRQPSAETRTPVRLISPAAALLITPAGADEPSPDAVASQNCRAAVSILRLSSHDSASPDDYFADFGSRRRRLLLARRRAMIRRKPSPADCHFRGHVTAISSNTVADGAIIATAAATMPSRGENTDDIYDLGGDHGRLRPVTSSIFRPSRVIPSPLISGLHGRSREFRGISRRRFWRTGGIPRISRRCLRALSLV